MTTKVRTRFAPSPTGFLHVGGARTALYSWLYAKNQGGEFVLRIEDTDEDRNSKESLGLVLQDLKWLGLTWDEGPEVLGPNQPYFQSERKSIYKEHAERLLKSEKAYYCFCSEERLEKIKEEAKKEGRPPQYDGHCRKVSKEEGEERIKAGEKATVRFRIPLDKDIYSFHDIVRNEVQFPKEMVGDFIILRSDGMPVYNFCCAVDDALMNISHVVRAEEHLSNTLRQIMLLEAFDYPLPQYAHVSIILGEDKQKLSKRHGATSCGEYKKRGYLPEALNNFLALLGWSSPDGEEIMLMETLVEKFDLNRVHGSPAVFDETKLKWMNSQYLRALSDDDLWERTKPFLEGAGLKVGEDGKKALQVFKTSMETLKDAVELYRLLDDEHFVIDESAKEVLGWDTSAEALKTWQKLLESSEKDYLSEEDFSNMQNAVKEQAAVKGKQLFMPLRVAVIGKAHGAELKQLVPLIKKKSLLNRVEKVLLSV